MEAILNLLKVYNFDLKGRSLQQIGIAWQEYDPQWLRLAVTEAIYRGRYKVISVEEILRTWQRKQQPIYQFDPEFEELVWQNLQALPVLNSTIVERLKNFCET